MFEKFEEEIGDHVPGARKAGVAQAAPRPQPLLRRDPEAGPRRPLPPSLARAERRRPLFRERDVPQPRDRGRPRLGRAGLTVVEDILGKRLPGFEETWRY